MEVGPTATRTITKVEKKPDLTVDYVQQSLTGMFNFTVKEFCGDVDVNVEERVRAVAAAPERRDPRDTARARSGVHEYRS